MEFCPVIGPHDPVSLIHPAGGLPLMLCGLGAYGLLRRVRNSMDGA